MANQVPGFGINTSCIRGIKSMYKTKLGSKGCRMRGMDEFQVAEKEERGESKREVSLTGTAAAEPEPRIVTTKEQSTKKSRRDVAKHSRGSASQGEPRPKKAKKGSEAKFSLSEVVPASVEEQEEEEEEEEGEVLTLRSRGLRSRGPAILAEGEPVGESVITEEVEHTDVNLVGRDDVEIPGVSTQPGSSSAHKERVEV